MDRGVGILLVAVLDIKDDKAEWVQGAVVGLDVRAFLESKGDLRKAKASTQPVRDYQFSAPIQTMDVVLMRERSISSLACITVSEPSTGPRPYQFSAPIHTVDVVLMRERSISSLACVTVGETSTGPRPWL